MMFLSLQLLSCSAPVEINTVLTKDVVLHFFPMTENAQYILLSEGQVTLYKNNEKLMECTIETLEKIDNRCQLDKVDMSPPYEYRVRDAKIKGFQNSRIVPIGTQGGLVTPKEVGVLNPANNTLEVEKRLREGDVIQFEGNIEASLETPGVYNLPEVIVSSESPVS